MASSCCGMTVPATEVMAKLIRSARVSLKEQNRRHMGLAFFSPFDLVIKNYLSNQIPSSGYHLEQMEVWHIALFFLNYNFKLIHQTFSVKNRAARGERKKVRAWSMCSARSWGWAKGFDHDAMFVIHSNPKPEIKKPLVRFLYARS